MNSSFSGAMISSSSLGSKKGLLWLLGLLFCRGQVPPRVEAESSTGDFGITVEVDWVEYMLEVRRRSSTEVVERELLVRDSGFGRVGLDCVDGTSWSSSSSSSAKSESRRGERSVE